MARVIALVQSQSRPSAFEALRITVVCGCALALIVADKALPYITF